MRAHISHVKLVDLIKVLKPYVFYMLTAYLTSHCHFSDPE